MIPESLHLENKSVFKRAGVSLESVCNPKTDNDFHQLDGAIIRMVTKLGTRHETLNAIAQYFNQPKSYVDRVLRNLKKEDTPIRTSMYGHKDSKGWKVGARRDF